MAKKRKKSKSHSRRRRVSGIGGGAVMEIVGIAVGAVGAQFAASKFAASLDPKILAAVEAVGGIFLASKGKGMIASIGKGVAVAGFTNGAKQFGLISGIGAAPMVTFSQNSMGYPNIPSINGFDRQPGLNGVNTNDLAVINGIENQWY